MKIFCQKCGNELKEGVVICPKCGFENKVAKKNRKIRLLLLFILPLIVSIALLTTLYFKGKIKIPENIDKSISSIVGIKEYSGKDLIENSLKQREEGSYNWEAYIKDERDGKKYRIVKMPDGKWWMAENLNYQKNLLMNERADFANSVKIENPKDGTQGIGSFWCNDALPDWPYGMYDMYDTLDFEGKANLRKAYGPRPTREELTDRYPGAKGSKNQLTTIESCSKYGAFYTWETAVLPDGKGNWEPPKYTEYLETNSICPNGWKLPSDQDWSTLLNSLEYESNGIQDHDSTFYSFAGLNAGRLLKTIQISEKPDNNGYIWVDNSCGALDRLFGSGCDQETKQKYINLDFYGFSVIPAGLKTEDVYFWKTRAAYFWTNTEDNEKDAKFRSFQSEEPRVFTGQHAKARAMSVRCIKEN